VEDFGKKNEKLGWESFVDNLKKWVDGWRNYNGNLKSLVDDWKTYWNVGSGLNGLTVSDHCCFGSMRNLGNFSSQDCTFVRKDYCWAFKRPLSSV